MLNNQSSIFNHQSFPFGSFNSCALEFFETSKALKFKISDGKIAPAVARLLRFKFHLFRSGRIIFEALRLEIFESLKLHQLSH